MSRPPFYTHVFRPTGHDPSPYSTAAGGASPPMPQQQPRAPYSAAVVAAAAAAAGYHPASAAVTAGASAPPVPAHHDVRWLGGMPSYPVRTAQPQQLLVRESDRDRVERISVPRMHMHDPHAAAEIYALEQRRYKQLQQQHQQQVAAAAAAAEVRRIRRPTLLPSSSVAGEYHPQTPSPAAVAAAMAQQQQQREDRPQLIHPAFRGYSDRDGSAVVPHQLSAPPSSIAASGHQLHSSLAAVGHQRGAQPPPAKMRILEAKGPPAPPGRQPPPPHGHDVRLPLHIVTCGAGGEAHSFYPPPPHSTAAGAAHRESYNPQTEAISPTLPPDNLDESPLRSTKDDLLQQISTIDREIMKTESQIAKLKRKQNELEDQANKPDASGDDEDERETKNKSLAQIVYAENRKKSRAARGKFDKLISQLPIGDPATWRPYMVGQPLYNQPSDTAVYQRNRRGFTSFKPRLVGLLQRRWQRRRSDCRREIDQYSVDISAWIRQVERIESLPKNRQKAAKNREFYEKVFPEIRKAREERERFNRVGRMIKSDAEMEEVLDGIQEQENEVKKMKAMAVIPPPLLCARRRRLVFVNGNGLINGDPLQLHNELPNCNVWMGAECDLFRERYLQHPKQFHVLSGALERKATAECVQHYYMSKKKEKYKERLKKARSRGRNRGLAKPAVTTVEVIGGNATGVTTRGSVAALQREKGGCAADMAPDDKPPPSAGAAQPPSAALPTDQSDGLVHAAVATPIAMDSATDVSSDSKSDKRRERRKGEEERRKNLVSSDEDGENAGKGGPHACAVCQAQLEHFGQSRPLPTVQASVYGLSEHGLPEDARVCTACRCRSVKRRYSHIKCPIPTCPTPKFRVKRLRPLPARWADITHELRHTVMQELQIPPEVVKCCSACHNRMARRIGGADGADSATAQWSDSEVERLRSAIRQHGPRWSKLSEALGGRRTASHCKRFYIDFKDKHRLDEVMSEFKRLAGCKDGQVGVTDEETGSSTSSADELALDRTMNTSSAAAPVDAPSAVVGVATGDDVAVQDVHMTSVESTAAGVLNGDASPDVVNNKHAVNDRGDSSATMSADEAAEPDTAEKAAAAAAADVKSPAAAAESAAASERTSPQQAVQPLAQSTAALPPRTSVVMGDLIDVTINNSFRHALTKDQLQSSIGSPRLTINSLLAAPERGVCVSAAGGAEVPPPPAPQTVSLLAAGGPMDDQAPQDLSVRRSARPDNLPAAPQPPAAAAISLTIRRPPEQMQQHPHHLPQQQDTRPPPAHRAVVSRPPDVHLEPPRDSYFPPSELVRVRSPSQPVFMTDPRAPLMLPRATVAAASLLAPRFPPRQQPPPLTSATVRVASGQHHPPPAHTPTHPSQHHQPPPRAADVKTMPISVRTGSGSITHGTPMVSVAPPQAYEGLLRPMVPQQQPKEGGSITQGTPMHADQKRREPGVLVVVQDRPPYADGRHQMARASPNHQLAPSPAASYPYHPGFHHPPRQHHQSQPTGPPVTEPMSSSRRVLMTDYITSQQMQQERRAAADKQQAPQQHQPVYFPPGYGPAASYLRYPATSVPQPHHSQQQQQFQQRPGVIQRPVASRPPSKPSPRTAEDPYQKQQPQQYAGSGQDNFNTLVDVAVVLGERERDQRYGRPLHQHEQRIREQAAAAAAASAAASRVGTGSGSGHDKNNLTTMGLIETIISRSINQDGRGGPPTSAAGPSGNYGGGAAVGDAPADMRAAYRVARSPGVPRDLVMLEQERRPASRTNHHPDQLQPPPDDHRPARSTPLSAAPLYSVSRSHHQAQHPQQQPFPMSVMSMAMPRPSVSAVPRLPPSASAPPPGPAHRINPGLQPPPPQQEPYPYRYRKVLPPRSEAAADAERLAMMERARYVRDERQIIRVAQAGSPERRGGVQQLEPSNNHEASNSKPGPATASQQQQQHAVWARRQCMEPPTVGIPGIASPLDYVKYKIAEVMRTSEHGGDGEGAGPERRPPSGGGAVRSHSPAVLSYEGVKRPRLEHDAPPPTDLRTKPPTAADDELKQRPAGFYPYKPTNGDLHPMSHHQLQTHPHVRSPLVHHPLPPHHPHHPQSHHPLQPQSHHPLQSAHHSLPPQSSHPPPPPSQSRPPSHHSFAPPHYSMPPHPMMAGRYQDISDDD